MKPGARQDEVYPEYGLNRGNGPPSAGFETWMTVDHYGSEYQELHFIHYATAQFPTTKYARIICKTGIVKINVFKETQ